MIGAKTSIESAGRNTTYTFPAFLTTQVELSKLPGPSEEDSGKMGLLKWSRHVGSQTRRAMVLETR